MFYADHDCFEEFEHKSMDLMVKSRVIGAMKDVPVVPEIELM